ncbi:hypothetical protein BCON_0034g00210 [Botryotinia convoluta]|uniref:Uncharacterized protein n=1 Tax=Botryotinia convoluta TaxID=54673 RepID=A0A4Z1IGS6_9HELO|nr:hypothetical protein BCON_0034g00210 [Botryotinia convoluta]
MSDGFISEAVAEASTDDGLTNIVAEARLKLRSQFRLGNVFKFADVGVWAFLRRQEDKNNGRLYKTQGRTNHDGFSKHSPKAKEHHTPSLKRPTTPFPWIAAALEKEHNTGGQVSYRYYWVLRKIQHLTPIAFSTVEFQKAILSTGHHYKASLRFVDETPKILSQVSIGEDSDIQYVAQLHAITETVTHLKEYRKRNHNPTTPQSNQPLSRPALAAYHPLSYLNWT